DASVRPVHARINSAGLIRFLSPNYYILPDENFCGRSLPHAPALCRQAVYFMNTGSAIPL
ncbi:hypothetical protein, partial [Morganella morganii]|uniref:hypothetical protein n=1 Tax=Morganella morganii TaxID=582 RepID=UPI002713338C